MALVIHEDIDLGESQHDVVIALSAPFLELSPFPNSTRQLIERLRQPDFDFKEVARIAESDPPLTAHVLRVVNSPFYSLPSPCLSIERALTLLGAKQVVDIIIPAALFGLFEQHDPTGLLVRAHCATVGAICQCFARRRGIEGPVAVGGLLHDIGKLFLLQSEEEEYGRWVTPGMLGLGRMHTGEKALFGCDHAELAGQLLRHWGIPAPIPAMVAWHHQVERVIDSKDRSVIEAVCLVHVADRLSQPLAGGNSPDPEWIEEMIALPASRWLELTPLDLAEDRWNELKQAVSESVVLVQGPSGTR